MKNDQFWMARALDLARQAEQQGEVPVGAVIVRDDELLGEGWNQPISSHDPTAHAEIQAIRNASNNIGNYRLTDTTLYVTLEPCSHHGRTPPCCDSLIRAGITRVVSALQDPDERVNGHGIQKLQDAGIEVTEGVCESDAIEANLGFIYSKTIDRPLVTLKMATSIDGKIATRTGSSKWITGPFARRFGHILRAQNDGILVGTGTALADNPSLTCRV